ncbi:hypothetical protein GOP47_0009507 [Adiantum capillus-veneris]|uniref:WD repeat-containing protein 25 n=1 Tax=Adiantum capillus-veneris TaxID=13818 RepID=A0A9D4ZJK3_ADICA|nr:hypothetical protein GOP47_0009507 [Adiantum capillus-veneris]
MESLISAYGIGEDEDEDKDKDKEDSLQKQEVDDEETCYKKRKRAPHSPPPPLRCGQETATCIFIGPAELPPHSPRSSNGDEETANGVFIGPLERPPHVSPPSCCSNAGEEPAACFFGPAERPCGPAERPHGLSSARPSLECHIPLPHGRYISKRERAALSSTVSEPINPHSEQLSSGLQRLNPADISWNGQVSTNSSASASFRSHLPKGLFIQLKAHVKAITAVRWSPTHSSLLASAGLDCAARVWDTWSKKPSLGAVRSFISDSAAKDMQWSPDGRCLLTCGFDQTSRLNDLETGLETQVFKEDQIVNVIKFHPVQTDLFLSGGSKGVLRLWDVRSGAVAQEFRKGQGQIMDVDFDREGKHFVSASDIADRNSSDRTIIVWDFATQLPLSHQIYLEPYTCPCVRYHPFENVFVAQSHGNYIALFSGHPPFRMNKHKRFERHEVSGYRIQCNFSPDGELLLSGSSNGQVYIYHYKSAKVLKELEGHVHVCVDVSYHPCMPSVVASGGWEGNICIYK